MENTKTKQAVVNKRYLAVDLHQGHFSEISVDAIYDLYAKANNVSTYIVQKEYFSKSDGTKVRNRRFKTFQHCLEFLRKREE